MTTSSAPPEFTKKFLDLLDQAGGPARFDPDGAGNESESG